MQNFVTQQNNTGEKNLHTVKDRADTVLGGILRRSCLQFCFSWHSAFSLYSSPVCNRLTIMNNDVMVGQRARLFWKSKWETLLDQMFSCNFKITKSSLPSKLSQNITRPDKTSRINITQSTRWSSCMRWVKLLISLTIVTQTTERRKNCRKKMGHEGIAECRSAGLVMERSRVRSAVGPAG